MSSPDHTWTAVSAIAQIFAALSTLLAVIVSLWLATAERRIRLRISAGSRTLANVTSHEEVIVIRVENVGLRPAKIDSLGWMGGIPTWKIPRPLRWMIPDFFRQKSVFQLQDYNWSINEIFPWRIDPGESKSTLFRREEYFREFTYGGIFFRKIPFLKKYIAVRPRVFVGVDTEEAIFGNIEKNLIKEFKKEFESKVDK